MPFYSDQIQTLTELYKYSLPIIQTLHGGLIGLGAIWGIGMLPKDTLTCGLEELEIELPTFQLALPPEPQLPVAMWAAVVFDFMVFLLSYKS